MKWTQFLAACVALAVTAEVRADPPPEADPKGALVVRVVVADPSNANAPRPLSGVTIVVRGETGDFGRGTTDTKGSVRIDRLPIDDVIARVEADGFVAEEKDVEIEEGKEATLVVTLSAGTPFDGTVVDDETGKPIADARVHVEARGSIGGFTAASFRSPYAVTMTDAKGRFHVNGVPEGQVATVEAVAVGHAGGAFALRVLGGHISPSPVVVRLPRGGAVVGVVRDTAEHPVGNATVYVMPAASDELRANPRGWRISSTGERQAAATATTDAGGRFRVEGLPLDVEYVAVAEADGFAWSDEVEGLSLTKSHPEVNTRLALRPAATLVVLVVDPLGKLVTSATVEIGASPGATEKQEAPDDEGAYRFVGLAPGKWPVSVKAQGFRPTWTNVVVEAGKTATETIKLDSGVSIEGIVVDEDGKPVPGASVSIETVGGNDPGPGGWTTVGGTKFKAGTDGRFAAKGLPPKEADVTAQIFHGPEKNRWVTTAAVRVKPPVSGIRLVLVARGTAIIRLVTPDGKPYVGKAMVSEWEAKVGGSGSGQKVEDGTVVFTGLNESDYSVRIDIDGYVSVRRDLRGRLRSRIDLGTETLDPGLEVRGRVVDGSGSPIPGARISSNATKGVVASDEHGAFRILHLPKGAATFSADADDYLAASTSVEVASIMAPVEIRLPRGALVRGALVGADGKRAQEDIFVWRIGGDGKRLDTEEQRIGPEEDGSFATRLPPGRYRFVATADGNGGEPSPLGDFTLAEGETREVVLKLPK